MFYPNPPLHRLRPTGGPAHHEASIGPGCTVDGAVFSPVGASTPSGRQLLVITGASDGIGAEIARQLAAAHKGDAALVLAGRSRQKLDGVSAACSMFAAEAIVAGKPTMYLTSMRNSWVYDELYKARNIRPSFHYFGLYGGMLWSALDSFLFWRFRRAGWL